MSVLHTLMAGAGTALADLIRGAYPRLQHLWAEIEACEFCAANKDALEAGQCVLPPAGDLTHMLPRFWDEGAPDPQKIAAADAELAMAQRRRDALWAKSGKA